jgi:hypothetical protein
MDVYHRVYFISGKVDSKKWTQPWWDARKFTLAVKNEKVNGFFHIHQGFVQPRIDINNVGTVRRVFGQWLVRTITTNAPANTPLSLVPIPSTDAVAGVLNECRHMAMLTQSIAPYGKRCAVTR